jgi:hypothetical protein
MDQGCNLDIFEIITRKNELTKEYVKWKPLIFKWYQMDVKNIKCPLQCWEKHEAMRFMRDNIFIYKLEYNDIYQKKMKNSYTYVSVMSNCVPCVINYVVLYLYQRTIIHMNVHSSKTPTRCFSIEFYSSNFDISSKRFFFWGFVYTKKHLCSCLVLEH